MTIQKSKVDEATTHNSKAIAAMRALRLSFGAGQFVRLDSRSFLRLSKKVVALVISFVGWDRGILLIPHCASLQTLPVIADEISLSGILNGQKKPIDNENK